MLAFPSWKKMLNSWRMDRGVSSRGSQRARILIIFVLRDLNTQQKQLKGEMFILAYGFDSPRQWECVTENISSHSSRPGARGWAIINTYFSYLSMSLKHTSSGHFLCFFLLYLLYLCLLAAMMELLHSAISSLLQRTDPLKTGAKLI